MALLQLYATVCNMSNGHVQVVSMQKVQPEGEDDDSSFAAQALAPQVQPRLTSASMRTYAQASQAQPVAGSQQGGMNSMRVCAWQTLLTAHLANAGWSCSQRIAAKDVVLYCHGCEDPAQKDSNQVTGTRGALARGKSLS